MTFPQPQLDAVAQALHKRGNAASVPFDQLTYASRELFYARAQEVLEVLDELGWLKVDAREQPMYDQPHEIQAEAWGDEHLSICLMS